MAHGSWPSIYLAPYLTLRTVNFGDRLQASFTQVFGGLVPSLLGALVIVFAGYLLARLFEKIIERFLRKIHFNQMLERGGVTQAVERSGTHVNPTKVLANLIFWLVMFAVILIAANALGLSSLANVFSELVSYIPSVIAAIVIILVGIVLGNFVGGLIGASAGALYGGRALARIGRGGVVLLAVFMALQELGIANEIVTTAFAILFGAIALALALAFGLGNRDLAGEVVRIVSRRTRRWRANVPPRPPKMPSSSRKSVRSAKNGLGGRHEAPRSSVSQTTPTRRIQVRREGEGRGI
jgi:hypothetical protein